MKQGKHRWKPFLAKRKEKNSMLEINDVSKVYAVKKGPTVQALSHVCLDLPAAGLVFLCGTSGSGKSTLLHLLAGLDRPTSGKILWKKKELSSLSEKRLSLFRRKEVGYVFQEYNLLEGLSVEENVSLALQMEGWKHQEAEKKAKACLAKVGLQDFSARRPDELSGGQRQRVAIARALCKDPSLVLCDEPTGALDSVNGAEVFALLKQLSQDRLVVVASHDKEAARKYGDRIITLKDGSLIQDETLKPCSVSDSGPSATEKARKPWPISSLAKLSFRSLGQRKGRLILTQLICVLSLALFGVAFTFSRFDPVRSEEKSLTSSASNPVSVALRLQKNGSYFSTLGLSQESLTSLNEKTGLGLSGYVSENLDMSPYLTPIFEQNYQTPLYPSGYASYYYSFGPNKILPYDSSFASHLPLVCGQAPQKDNEILITDYQVQTFARYGFYDPTTKTYTQPEDFKPEILLGKPIDINNPFVITGVLNTNFSKERYASFAKAAEDNDPYPASGGRAEDTLFYSEVVSGYQNAAYVTSSAFTQGQDPEKAYGFVSPGMMLGNNYFSQFRYYHSDYDGYLFFDNLTSLPEDGYLIEAPLLASMSDGKETFGIDKEDIADSSYQSQLASFEASPIEFVQILASLAVSDFSAEKAASFKTEDPADYARYYVSGEGDQEIFYSFLVSLLQSDVRCYTSLQESYRKDYLASKKKLLSKYYLRYQDALFPQEKLTISSSETHSLRLCGVDMDLLGNSSDHAGLVLPPLLSAQLAQPYGEICYGNVLGRAANASGIRYLCQDTFSQKDTSFFLTGTITTHVFTLQQQNQSLGKILIITSSVLGAFSLVLLSMYLLVMIDDKKKEIGILKAMGAKGSDLYGVFALGSVSFALILSLFTTVLLFVLSAALNQSLMASSGIPVLVLTPSYFEPLVIFLISLVSALLCSGLPTWKAMHEDTIATLREE
jgi:ABC-type lipoprotein export system ATPase subunit